MDKKENYRGYEIGWQDPPMTSAGFDITVASEDKNLQERLERAFACKGAYVFRSAIALEEALKVARTTVDSALARPF